MHRELRTEVEVLSEVARVRALLQQASPRMKAVYRYRLRYCRMLLAAMRDGCPERWPEYDEAEEPLSERQA